LFFFPEAEATSRAHTSAAFTKRFHPDGETPSIFFSASAGVASFPADGDTPEKLLAAADRALYRMKNRSSSIKNLSRSPRASEDRTSNAKKSHQVHSFHRAERRIPMKLACFWKANGRRREPESHLRKMSANAVPGGQFPALGAQ